MVVRREKEGERNVREGEGMKERGNRKGKKGGERKRWMKKVGEDDEKTEEGKREKRKEGRKKLRK